MSKRLFGVIPNYRADQYTQQYVPLSTAEKFNIARHDSFDWPNYLLLVGYAMQSQMAAGNGHQKSVVAGFANFYMRSVADQIQGSYITEAILPWLLHEDPRFFRLGTGSVWRRTYSAASSVIINRRDSGATGVNYSELVGNMGVAGLGNLYYTNNQSVSNVFERYGMSVGNDVISNLLNEFWPDIRRRLPLLHHR